MAGSEEGSGSAHDNAHDSAHSSEDDEDWDNLEDWGDETPIVEGVVAPTLRETVISPTTSWDEEDEPWPTAGQQAPGRGVGAPRSPVVSWDQTAPVGTEWRENTAWQHRPGPARPPMEGVVSPNIADRQVDETFAWAPDETWNPGEASTRGLGRPRTEAERLEELRRIGENPFGDIMPPLRPGEGWADDTQGWVVQQRQPSPPPMEGVLSPSVAARQGLASTFNLGEGVLREVPEDAAGRGIGRPRNEQERLELLRQEQAGPGDEWVRFQGDGSPEELLRQIPVKEGVLAPGPSEDTKFAETLAWEGEPDTEWGPAERTVPPGRGTGVPVLPAIRLAQATRLPMTKYEAELLRSQGHGVPPGDWAVNLPRGDAVARGDEVEAWQRILAPTGPLPAIQPGHKLQSDPDVEKGSDATPSSFNTDKQFDLMKDISMRYLPDFASDENRALNIMVQEAERALRDVKDATQEQDDRTAVMEDHMKRVQEEITATQQRVEAKRREIASEEHLEKLTTFQAARLKREVTKMEGEMHEMVERLRNFRAAILRGNDKLDKIRQVQQWNEQELEQWVEATLQKDEDFVALTSYAKYDNTRIKALRLKEQMVSGELAKVEELLQMEMSETQSYQVQLDKTASEFRQLHEERQFVVRQWEEAIELVHKRDGDIHKLTEEFASNKESLRKEKRILDNLDLKLYNETARTADLERDILLKNLDAQRQRDALKQEVERLERTREALVNIKTDVFRAQHCYAKEVARKVVFQEEILRQKNMYKDSRKKLKKLRKLVEDEYDHLDTLEKRTHTLEKLLNTEDLNLKLAKKEVADLQGKHFKASEKLLSLRAAEGDTIHEIKGGKSIAKTLVRKISMLEIEVLKKEEKLYAADFQIQLLEGKVGRASGEQSNAEEIETTRQIKELEDQLEGVKREDLTISAQMKRSLNEMRASTFRKDELEIKNKKLNDKNAELNLECDAGLISNKAMTKEREEVALEVDLLQMEVQRLTDLLHSKADEVFNLDRLKQRLQQNMEDRKAEVDARQEIQRREMKIIGEELHDLKLKRQNLILKIDKLQCKYDCLRARMKSTDGLELTAEFFLEQLKSTREEIQKKGVELSEELRKVQVDVNFLEKATDQIQQSNNNLRTSLNDSEKTAELEEESRKLKVELGKAKDRARFKQREERSLLQDLAEVEAKVQAKEDECATAAKTCENFEYRIEHARKGQAEQTIKRKRAATRLNSLMRELREKASPDEAKRISGEFLLSEMRESTKDVLHKLKQLGQENPDYSSVIEMRVAAEGFKLPTGPASTRSVAGSPAESITSKASGDAATPSRGKGKIKSPSGVTGGASSRVVTVEFNG